MRVGGTTLQRSVDCFNTGVTALARSARLGPLVRRYITTATYR